MGDEKEKTVEFESRRLHVPIDNGRAQGLDVAYCNFKERLPGRRRTVATFITFRDRAFSLLCSDDEGAWTTPMKLSSLIPVGENRKGNLPDSRREGDVG